MYRFLSLTERHSVWVQLDHLHSGCDSSCCRGIHSNGFLIPFPCCLPLREPNCLSFSGSKCRTQETHDTGNKVVEVKDVMVHKVFVTIDSRIHAKKQRVRFCETPQSCCRLAKRRYVAIKQKTEGFVLTGEDKQQKIETLIMSRSCERVRLKRSRGVWEEQAGRQTDGQIETVVRCVINPWRQTEHKGQRSAGLAAAGPQRKVEGSVVSW